jgi:hypothetical protein
VDFTPWRKTRGPPRLFGPESNLFITTPVDGSLGSDLSEALVVAWPVSVELLQQHRCHAGTVGVPWQVTPTPILSAAVTHAPVPELTQVPAASLTNAPSNSVDDLDVLRIGAARTKANAPLVVDTDAVLSQPIAGQLLQVVCWWNSKVGQARCGVEHLQLA